MQWITNLPLRFVSSGYCRALRTAANMVCVEELLIHVAPSSLAYYAFIKITLAPQHFLFDVVCISHISLNFIDELPHYKQNWYHFSGPLGND